MNNEWIERRPNPVLSASLAVWALATGALLCVFVSPLLVIVPIVGGVLMWSVIRFPISILGAVLAFMPLDFMAVAMGKFFGLPHMTLVSALDKEVILLVIAFIMWQRYGFRPAPPDWFLLGCLFLAVVRTCFGGTSVGLATDFAFVVPYFVGRVVRLTAEKERRWATRAVWIVGVLSVLGLTEVFVLGDGPRTALYLAIGSETENGQLTASFHAAGFSGLREAATMIGPNGFGALCMIALVLWWVYSRNRIAGAIVAIGLMCSITRSAWIGTAVAVSLIALLMGQKKRLFGHAALAIALFAAVVPVLGLRTFLSTSEAGQDPSAQSHKEEIVAGLQYAVSHPFGGGNLDLSPVAFEGNSNVTIFETTYPYLSAAYGIAVAFCFIGFLITAAWQLWTMGSPLSRAALGILVGMAVVMVFTLPLTDRRLDCWAWFPIGLAIRSGTCGARSALPPSTLHAG